MIAPDSDVEHRARPDGEYGADAVRDPRACQVDLHEDGTPEFRRIQAAIAMRYRELTRGGDE